MTDTAAGTTAEQPKMYPALRRLEKESLPIVGHMPPYKRPVPARMWRDTHIPFYNWVSPQRLAEVRSGVHPELVTTDISAAYLSAASSTSVAHGPLVRTGAFQLWHPKQVKPGYYFVDVHPWQWSHRCPSPLGDVDAHLHGVWIAHPTLILLLELSEDEEAAWPGVDVLDSWTCETTCMLTKWTTRLREERKGILGRLHAADENSPEYEQLLGTYDAFKRGYSAALAMLRTEPDPKGTPMEDRGKKNLLFRPDWTDAFYAQHASNMFRKSWRFSRKAPLYAVQNTDEMVMAKADLILASRDLKWRPFRFDPSGLTLGSVKIKSHGWDLPE